MTNKELDDTVIGHRKSNLIVLIQLYHQVWFFISHRKSNLIVVIQLYHQVLYWRLPMTNKEPDLMIQLD
jgi:hypothetical protein